MKAKNNEKKRTTGIEWTDHTWNPFVGCSIKTSGCNNCYAMALASRLALMGNPIYEGTTKRAANGKVVWTGVLKMQGEAVLSKPGKISKPSIFFVNSMSDFFHANATDEMKMKALLIMEKLRRHQFQILTKRPENIQPFLDRTGYRFPENVWIGATVEDGRVKDRIDMIRAIPARIRFLSVEPLIGPLGPVSFKGIQWVITGGESGPGAREMRPEWMREVRDQLIRDGVPHFFKQWGKPENNPFFKEAPKGFSGSGWVALKDPIGKGGSLLDGTPWKQLPGDYEVAAYGEKESTELSDDLFKQ